jgi:hypothetical protein
MQLTNLVQAVRTRLTTDTGTGGLFNAGNELVGGVFFQRAGTEAVPTRYLVITIGNVSNDDDMSNNLLQVQFNINVHITRIEGDTIVQSNIIDRVYERLHDWTPTLSAWAACGPIEFVDAGGTDLPDEESSAYQLTFQVLQSKVRTTP